MDNKLPLRLMVLTYINSVAKSTVEEAMDALRSQYGSERQFTHANFVDHFLALKENGLIDDIEYDLDEKKQLRIYYAINDAGKEVLEKYGK